MKRLRDLLPANARDLVLPRLREAVASAPPELPPWEAPASGSATRLECHRFEHAGRHHRLHLRVNEDGSGLVVVDASRLARLDSPGVATLRAWLAAGAREAPALERSLWGGAVLTGDEPLRGCNAWESAGRVREPIPEIPLVATLEVPAGSAAATVERVRRLRDLLVPHVVLRPLGEGAAPALLAGVRAAEDAGLIAGVAAPADFVDDGCVLDDLAALGLDHLALTLAGDGPELHDAVMGAGEHAKLARLAQRAAELEVPLTGEIPLVDATWAHVEGILSAASRLGMAGVTAWALVRSDDGPADALEPRMLIPAAAALEAAADRSSLRVTWAAPARARDLRGDIVRGPRTDGDFGMRVTASGTVLPPRGSAESAGNLATSGWVELHNSPSWRAFLARARGVPRCDGCPGLVLCTVDCPAAGEGWA